MGLFARKLKNENSRNHSHLYGSHEGGPVRALPINAEPCTHATCQACEKHLPVEHFPIRSDRSGRRRPYCKECARDGQRARYVAHKRDNPFALRTTRARSRAQNLKVPFDLTPEYLQELWTGVCPVFGMPISLNDTSRVDEYAAELDRFIPERGYVKGNVAFLSRRANRLKNNTTTRELAQLLKWMESYENR